MPNIASRFGESATCISFSENKARSSCYYFIRGSWYGSVIDEKLMDAATVLAASGTAFALRYKSIDAGWYRNRV
jgi:pyrroline-5-carboxylate reductase